MADITGKAYGILERMQHYFHPEIVGDQTLRIIDIFGRRLELNEKDIYEVLRAHHVQTADNLGASGYIAKAEDRGALDKIFALYLEYLGGTSQVVQMNPQFTHRSFNARVLSRRLLEKDHPLYDLLTKNFKAATWDILKLYAVENSYFEAGDITPGFALELVLCKLPLSKYIRSRLGQDTLLLLSDFGGDDLSTSLKEAIVRDINTRLLNDSSLFKKNYKTVFSNILNDDLKSLLHSVYWEFFSHIYKKVEEPEKRDLLLQYMETIEPALKPPGEDLIRLNRMLLEQVYGFDAVNRAWGFKSAKTPSLETVRKSLVKELNKLLKVENLYTTERFPDLIEDYKFIEKRFTDDEVGLNRELLENAYPLEIEKRYAPYRDRLLGLIQVLKRGASTRQGILDIVTANLGILGDDIEAVNARKLIRIDEFLPRRTSYFKGDVSFYQEFDVDNTSPRKEAPEIRITIADSPAASLTEIRIMDKKTGNRFRYTGRVKANDRLVIKGDTILKNGVTPAESLVGEVPEVPPGISTWQFKARIDPLKPFNPPAGLFDASDGFFDRSVYETPAPEEKLEGNMPIGRFDYLEGVFDESIWGFSWPVAKINVLSYKYTPAVFTVTIPWHIPGFTDKFVETEDHPRHQILSLVNRVKAAGVRAMVAYVQKFSETHLLSDHLAKLGLNSGLLDHDHEITEKFSMYGKYKGKENHEIKDGAESGKFDKGTFDSDSTFSYGFNIVASFDAGRFDRGFILK